MADPLRIFHIAGGARETGAGRFLIQMADHMDARAFRMAVVLPEKGPLEDELRARHVPVELIPLSAPKNVLAVKRLARLFAAWKPNVVQGHGMRSNFYARLAAGGIPCISTFHDPLSPGRWFSALADRVTVRKSAAVVCVSEWLREEFLKRCPSFWEKTHVIPGGVDLERFDPRRHDREEARRSLNLGERWTLLLVGRLIERKGHMVLLKALSRIKDSLPPFRALFAGEGPLERTLKRQAERDGLGENIVFLGSRRDMPDVLTAADLVLAPSLAEGSPQALMEAMAMGKTVIASHVGAVKEVMPSGEEGYLIPVRSIEKMIEAILTARWNKDDARKRAEAGRRRVQREHDVKKTASRWEALYRSITGDLLIQ